MAELHNALTLLSPVDWRDVPKENLEPFLTQCITSGELICNSVPPPAEGTPFNVSKPHHDHVNAATGHREIHASLARPHPPHEEHLKLRKHWGKPYKFKDNPLKIQIYKMAGNDRHGAWFARSSVHEGLGFDKFKRAMMREFTQSMSVQGGPGAGAVRGLAADRRLESIDVPGCGKLEVYELSAQFPGPVTPRDFLAMVMSSDGGLTEKSAAEVDGGQKHVPRHLMVVSRPVHHPHAPARPGFVRGQYESVELIREIPLTTTKPKSTSDLLRKSGAPPKTGGFSDVVDESSAASKAGSDPELNPVEWIMVTRSDPGGGIPRFLVERGTPESMIADVHKFFDWACAQAHIPHPHEASIEQHDEVDGSPSAASHTAGSSTSENNRPATEPTRTEAASEPGQQKNASGGIISSLTRALEAGMDAYAPTAVTSMVHSRIDPEQETASDSSDTSSLDSFISAEEIGGAPHASETRSPESESFDTLSGRSSGFSEDSTRTPGMSHHERKVQELVRKRARLEQQLARKRMAEEQKARENQEKGQTEEVKSREKMEKELHRTEGKHRKAMEKVEAKKAKEARKAEEKRRKKEEQKKMSLVRRERDEFRSQLDLYKKENNLLHEHVAELQAQNTLLAQRLGKVGGEGALKKVQQELGHQRTGSMKSMKTIASLESVPFASKSLNHLGT